jgi:Cytochrome c553
MRLWTSVVAATFFSVGSGMAADLELGAYLAQDCLGCHQAEAHVGTIPIIHGLEQDYFIEAMYDYRDGLPGKQCHDVCVSIVE